MVVRTIALLGRGMLFAGAASLSVAFLLATVSAAEPAGTAGHFGRGADIRKKPLRVTALDGYGKPPLTIELWARLSEEKKARYNVLASHLPQNSPGHWEIYTTPLDGLLTARVRGKSLLKVPTFVRITDNEWHYIALTYGGGKVTVYVDGKPVGQGHVSPSRDQAEGELFVGTEFDRSWAAEQPGVVDELRISNAIRDTETIPQQAFAPDEHTIGLWHFDETAGNTYRDASTFGNSLAYSPGVESAWTPRSATRIDAPDWEKETDDDWQDARFDAMDKGPVFGCAMSLPSSPGSGQRAYAAKGLAIRVGETGDAAVLFDRGTLQMCGGWTGGFLRIPPRRFGLIERPEPVGDVLFSAPREPGWSAPPGVPPRRESQWAPLPIQWGHYRGYYRRGDLVVLSYTVGDADVLEVPGAEHHGGRSVITRDLEIGPSECELTLNLLTLPGQHDVTVGRNFVGCFAEQGSRQMGVVVPAMSPMVRMVTAETPEATGQRATEVRLVVEPRREAERVRIIYCNTPADQFDSQLQQLISSKLPPLKSLTIGGSSRGTETITTRGTIGDAAGKPFAVDTLTLPVENPYGSIFYITGLGFLPDERIAICTIYGDVWLVDGVTDDLQTLTWKRFASGLYQPMGLVVRDGKVLVLERGQVTRLHDRNGDDEADFYESYYDGWQTTGDGHAYDTGLKLAPDGSLFFFKGQTGKPAECRESGCLLRIAPSGQSHEIVATGFRHPIGLGMSPDGVVTGADQQGNWMPATRIDGYRKGGFYGDMRTHHRDAPPSTYDPPICWLPRDVDNSAGGQVWVPQGNWGPLGGKMLHLSWGRCRVFHLMHEEIGGQWQGGVVPLPCETLLSGPITGAFRPEDGHLYVVGLHGWQTAAEQDGCLQRIRYTGNPLHLPRALRVHEDGLSIEFSGALDPSAVEDPANYDIQRWNYRWSGSYGSDHWSVADPDRQGHDPLPVRSAELSADGRTIRLTIEDLRPVMQMRVAYRLKAADGTSIQDAIHHTIHTLAGLPPAEGR